MKITKTPPSYSQPSSHSNHNYRAFEIDLNEQSQHLSPKNYQSVHIPENQNSAQKTNQLPINLFYGAGEYNKLLITNGRSRKKKSQPFVQGFLDNLEFINDSFFQNCQEMRRERRKISKQSSERKKVNNSITCCQESVRRNTFKPQQRRSSSKKKRNHSSKKKKVITSKSKMEMEQKKISREQSSNSYLSHRIFHINNLIHSSLIKFEEEKRQQRRKRKVEQKEKQDKSFFLKNYGDEIRKMNKISCQENSIERPKSMLSKSRKRMMYWSSVKDYITESLKQKVEKVRPLEKQYVQCHHKITVPFDAQIYLSKQHQKQALLRLKREKFDKKVKQQKKLESLNRLQRKRQLILQTCMKRPFKPTADMISNAFVNIQ